MNYRHIYHAGNFADIVKHLLLIVTINKMLAKDTAFAVLDAFAGCGKYDLQSELALKTLEKNEGIEKIRHIDYTNAPSLISMFMQLINKQENYYLGSPLIISSLMRKTDRLILNELHPKDYLSLKEIFIKHDKLTGHRINIYNLDAYSAIKAYLPFPEKRGLIFIDPPFEIKNEFDKIFSTLQVIYKRAMNICTIIWYPIKDRQVVDNFYNQIQKLSISELKIIEYYLPKSLRNMNKCGLLILNPSNIISELQENLDYIKPYLGLEYKILNSI